MQAWFEPLTQVWTQPEWLDYFRYPAKGEDLYSLGNGDVVLIGTGNYWQGQKLTLQFLNFDGTSLSLEDSVQLGTGYYMDSRRYGDYLYVMTREWISQLNPDGDYRYAPLIKLYTVSLNLSGEERVVDARRKIPDRWRAPIIYCLLADERLGPRELFRRGPGGRVRNGAA